MPIVRKILNVGNSQAVTLPKSWLKNAEETEGEKVVAMAMEVNGSITLTPIFLVKKTNSKVAGRLPTMTANLKQQSPHKEATAK